MGKKTLKTTSVEKCKKRCKGRILRNGKYCECIESRLPARSTRSVKLRFSNRIESFSKTAELYPSTTEETIEHLIYTFKRYGLESHEIDLIIDRYVGDKSLEEIAESKGWLNRGSAAYHLNLAITKLRERGFKIDDIK